MNLSSVPFLSTRGFVRTKLFIGLLGSLLAALNCCAAGLSSDDSFRNAQCDVWQTSDGLPGHDVVSLAQTPDGYLWLGISGMSTSFGLVRFNGFEFVSPVNRSQPAGPAFTRLASGKDGRLWVSTSAGEGSLLLWQNGRATSIEVKLPPPGDHGIPLYEDHLGNLWIGGNGLLIHQLEGRIQNLNSRVKQFGNIWQITEDKAGTVWLATDKGLLRYRQGVFDQPYPITNKLVSVCASKRGSLWVGLDSVPALAQITPTGEISYYGAGEGLSSKGIWAICEDEEATIWFGTYSGIYYLKENKVHPLQQEALRTAFIFSLMWDREGSLWVGTADGLYNLHKNPIETWGASAGVGAVSSLSVGPSGLWISIFSEGVFRQQGQIWTKQFGFNDGTGESQLVEISKGDNWLETEFHCYHIQDGKSTMIEVIGGKAHFCKAGSTLWFVNETNVFSYHNGELSAMDKGWPAMTITCVATNLDHGLLIGTTQGLYQWSGQLAKWIELGNDLPGTRINALEWTGQTLWLASDQVIARYQGRWDLIHANAGLTQAGGINSMLVESNNFWLGCVNGLFRIARAEAEQCLDGKLREVALIRYGKAQGMAFGYIGPSSWGQGAARGNDGRLWFASKSGVLAVDPKWAQAEPPPVVIESVMLDQQVVSNFFGFSKETIKLPAGTRNVEIHYAALTYVASDRAAYKYRLKGLDSAWAQAGNSRVARFTKLPPGSFEFQVQACNAEGLWNEQSASIRLVQEPFFYQTTAFVWLCCLLGLLVVLILAAAATRVAHLVSTRKMRRRLALLEMQQAMDRERARIARDIHDDVGSTLTQIVLLSELAGQEPEQTFTSDGHLVGIRSAAREITRRLDEIVWAINPRNDTLDALVSYISKFISDQARTAGLRCQLNLPENLPAWPINGAVRHNMFLACKEAIHNAIKHATASQLQLRLTIDERNLFIEISDNGMGLPTPLPKQGGNGLLNLQERLSALGGDCSFNSIPGQGTTVSFRVPRSEPKTSLSTK